jgi:hypothetical protein
MPRLTGPLTFIFAISIILPGCGDSPAPTGTGDSTDARVKLVKENDDLIQKGMQNAAKGGSRRSK